MRHRFFKRAGQIVQVEALIRTETENGFAEAEDAVSGGFEGLGGGIVRIAGDDDLDGVMGEEGGGQAICGSEKTVLGDDAGEGFQSFFGEVVVTVVAGEGVPSNQGDSGDGIGAGGRRILEGLAADVEAAHGCSVGRAIEEASTFGVAVAGDGEVHGFLRGVEVARIEGGFVSVEKREDAGDLIVERAFESGAAYAVAEAAGFAPDFFQHAVEGFQGEAAAGCAE